MNPLDIFILGCFMVIGIYHGILFLFHRRDYSLLFFSLITLIYSLVIITKLDVLLFADKIILASYILIPPLFTEFIRNLYPNAFTNSVTMRIHQIIRFYAVLFVGIVIFFPIQFFMNQIAILELLSIIINGLIMLFNIINLVNATRKKEPNAWILLIGFILLFASALFVYLVPGNLVKEIHPLSLLVLLVLFTFVLAKRNMNAYHQSLQLAEQQAAQINRQSNELSRLLSYDPMTNAYSRSYVMTKLEALFDDYLKNNRELSVILLDFDHFKKINDTYGQDSGDYLMKKLTTTMQENLHDSDFLGRMSGDEFIVVLSGQNETIACGYAEKLRIAIKHVRFNYKDNDLDITCSFGVATANKSMANYNELLKLADENLSLAKQGGRNQVAS